MKKVILSIENSRGYGRSLIAGISKYSRLHGPWNIYSNQPFYYHESTEERTILDMILIWGADGIIMREEPRMQDIIALGIPIIMITYLHRQYPGTICLEGDTEQSSILAARHFLEKGLKNFAYCGVPNKYWSIDRGLSFSAAIEEAGFKVDCYEFPKDVKFNFENDQICLFNWIESLPKPIGIMTCTDDRAKDVLEICKTLKCAVPFDVAVIGVDNDELLCEMMNPPLSSVALNAAKAGYLAAQMLHQLMDGQEIDSDQLIIAEATHVVSRQTTDTFAIDDSDMIDALQYIKKHIQKPIRIDDVMEGIAVSRRTLYEKFKKYLGMSVHQYIKNRRVEQIQTMLLETDYSISQIAHQLGFQSDEHIASYFRSVKGTNPNSFRVKMRHV